MQPQKPEKSQASYDLNRPEPTKDDREVILLGIDGTGELFDSDYEPSFADSFVNRIINGSTTGKKLYIRGPWNEGIDMKVLSDRGYNFVRLARSVSRDTKVLLTGYSRGGAGVVDVARKLQEDGVTVDAMVLFDPVDRSATSSAQDVPNNVLYMVKALRATMTLSRISFNNCATSWHSPTKCERKYFWATHGGIGGTPWVLQPGHTSKDYIDENEYYGETILASAVYDVPLLNWWIGWKQPDDYTGTLDELRSRRRELLGDRTQVTYEQDRIGADSVWEWVRPKLQRFGFLPKTKA